MLKETLWVNILRSFCAGVVWIIISLFMQDDGNPFYYKLAYPVLMPFILGLFYIVSLILKLFKLDWVGNILCMIAAVPGDPIVFMLHKLKPELVPVKEYKFIWFVAIISVYDLDIKSKPKTLDDEPTLIYSEQYGGSLISKVDTDGSIYDINGAYIGRYKDNFIYEGALGTSVLTRYDENGKIFHGMNDFEILGEVSKDGIIYEHAIAGHGRPIAKVEGTNIYVAAAAYFAFFRLK